MQADDSVGAVDKSLSLCNKLKKPSEANKEHLAKLFPSSSGTLPLTKPVSTAFDPIAECAALSQQQKKKKATTRERPRKVTCAASQCARNSPKIVQSQEIEQARKNTEVEILP